MQSWGLHIFLHVILRTYKVCVLKNTYSVLGDLVSSMNKLGMKSNDIIHIDKNVLVHLEGM
jgi:hypothetical protein